MTDITTSTQTVYTTSSVQISWDITAVRVYPSLGDLTNVVREIDWQLTGVSLAQEGSTSTVQASVTGTESVTYNSSKPFTDYHSLTQPQLINWVNVNIGHDRIMELIAEVKNKIQALQNPVSSIGLPW